MGVAVGMAVDAGFEAATGKALSTRLGEWASSDVDRKRAQLDGMSSMQSSARANSSNTTNTDNRVITVNVEAKGADAQSIAAEVKRELNMSMRDEELSSYGG